MAEKEYIDLETVYDMDTLEDWYINSVSDNDTPVWTEEHLEELLNDFYVIPKDTPAADAAPVRHGHWTEIDHSKNLGDYHFVCSECKCNTPDRAYVITPDFCPNCGAIMDGGEENV